MVIFLYRHSRQGAAAYEEAVAKNEVNHVEVIVAKNRTGKTGVATLVFQDHHMRFSDPESDSFATAAPGPSPFDN